jgi:hypothetical protein
MRRVAALCGLLCGLALSCAQAGAFTAPPIELPQTFNGRAASADEALGTITVGKASVLTWSCPGCGSSNFILHDDEYELFVNALDETPVRSMSSQGPTGT